MPFPQMGVALQNKAIDVANTVPPFGDLIAERGLGIRWLDSDDYIRPTPVVISAYMANTDWIGQHPDAARRVFLAVARGARDYCQAYHHGPNRREVEDILVRHKVFDDRDLLDRMAWQSRDPDGRINVASILDVQDWFFKAGLIAQEFPAERLVDASFAAHAAQALGPFTLDNKASQLAGCR